MVRPTDWKMMATEMMVFYSSQKDGSSHAIEGSHREASGLVKTQRELEENTRKRLYCSFC